MKIPTSVHTSLAALVLLSGIPTVSTAAVLADWTFNDGSGDQATDSSGNFYHGTLLNFNDLTAGAGNGGNSGWTSDGRLAFDGVDDHITTPFFLNTLGATSFTLETIVSHDNPSENWSPILGSAQTDFANIFFFGKQDGQNTVHYNFAGLGSQNTNVAFADGQVHHLAMVFDDSADTLTLFMDFEERFQASGVTGTLNAPSDLVIGGIGHAANERWNGTADRIRISDTALTPAEFIPEPTTGLLALVGLLAMGARRPGKLCR